MNNELVKPLLYLRPKKVLTDTVPLLHLTAPCSFNYVQTMKVFVEVPHAGNLLLGERNYCDSESRLPPLNVALVEALASLPFKRFFEANPDASLKELVCCFSNFIKELQSQICKIAFGYPIRIFIRLSLCYNPL